MTNINKQMKKIGVVIPVYNPSDVLASALIAINDQTYPISKVVVIDSSPGEGKKNLRQFVKEKCVDSESFYFNIPSEDFDHGRTRNFGVSKLEDIDAVLFLTQDGIMKKNCVKRLVDYIYNNDLAAAYARQVPRDGATELEAIERYLTYPPISRINSGTPRMIDDVLLSNVCSIYRIDAFKAAGGFPERIITAEDIVIANKLLRGGYSTGYCSEAIVMHSHLLSFTSTVKRYFDTGVMHAEWNSEIPFNTAKGKGFKLIKDEFHHMIFNKPTELGSFCLSVVGKVIGYSMGRKSSLLSIKIKRKFSQNRNFWR